MTKMTISKPVGAAFGMLLLLTSTAVSDWRIESTVSPRDDSVTYLLTGRTAKWHVDFKCGRNGKILLNIGVPGAWFGLSGNPRQVEWRVGKQPAQSESWVIIPGNVSAPDGGAVAEKWRGGDRVWVNVAGQEDFVLSLEGFFAMFDDLRQKCAASAK